MTPNVITVENLGKSYKLGGLRHDSARDQLVHAFRSMGGLLRSRRTPPTSLEDDTFWALKDVSFSIRRGESVGVIGANGAGKSTLLKLLSQITEPSEGEARIRGRLASLLEVGSGFHPELTGKENIFLNGSILGMSKAEIRNKFDEIVAFAEIEKFLGLPVKRYSSGMYVRLAFAVAAHLDPDILVIDEVLAVGDAGFQKKCLAKIKEVEDSDRTVLVVSHNMGVIQSLCSRCLLLSKGRLIADEAPGEAVRKYLDDSSPAASFAREANKNGEPSLVHGNIFVKTSTDGTFVRLDVQISSRESKAVAMGVRLTDGLGIPVGIGSLGALDPAQSIQLKPGITSVSATFPIDNLAVGLYHVSLDIEVPYVVLYDRADNCLAFEYTSPPRAPGTRSVLQKWGYGSLQIPMSCISLAHEGKNSAECGAQ